MSAEDRYAGCGSTLDEFIIALQDAREHGANGNAIVNAFDGDAGQDEAVTGFVIWR